MVQCKFTCYGLIEVVYERNARVGLLSIKAIQLEHEISKHLLSIFFFAKYVFLVNAFIFVDCLSCAVTRKGDEGMHLWGVQEAMMKEWYVSKDDRRKYRRKRDEGINSKTTNTIKKILII